ncbi:Bro-N domain-containing protein [Escherichia coli]|uniref:BRO-N domain-containing protein n=1 Tax=Escherichia coli TaxID=562 RepID=UPI0017D2D622|nr:antirepressor protein [Escherichia coli]EEZ7614637.1 Bro-N domain-containing protein [Escherichia coli]EFE7678817.1 Bro-N domain-containing protein [Escherichia coli]EHA2823442.1 Bro-N domain-containing protein [Escherichia coli]EHC4328403.1 Bro-N domain-containing protein [Escherichia coli]
MNKNIAVTGKGYARSVKKFCDIRDLVVLRFDGVDVRVVYLNGDPWFVAKDVCAALELTNSRTALQMLDDDEKGVNLTYTPGGNQNMSIISESGFYKLIARSRKEQYQISASEKGRELQACKRKKRELEEEEKRLIREYQPEFYFGERIQ